MKLWNAWSRRSPGRICALYEEVGEFPADEAQVDEQEWWAWLLGEREERFTIGDLIPDAESSEAWDQLEAEEQEDRLLHLMSDLPTAEQRRLLLLALEDYSIAEIARLQGRPESEVEQDIKAARQTLRERLLAAGYLQEAGELTTASASASSTSQGGESPEEHRHAVIASRD